MLSPEDFIAIVKTFHPVIKQADINIEKAQADITIARGGFDPSLYYSNDQKTFGGENYYNYNNTELKIPTWYGIEIKAGLDNNSGVDLNSESTFGKSSYVGISVPLAKNLLMDRRRAVLKQAKIFRDQSGVERLNTINDLLYAGYSAYWNWVKEYQVFEVITSTVKINEARFDLIKIAYRQGDRPGIDTVEALAQLQNFQFLQSESLVKLQNAAVELSNFLWQQNNTWYQLGLNVVPASNWNQQDIGSIPVVMQDELLFCCRGRGHHPGAGRGRADDHRLPSGQHPDGMLPRQRPARAKGADRLSCSSRPVRCCSRRSTDREGRAPLVRIRSRDGASEW